jgi:hypothetical protein
MEQAKKLLAQPMYPFDRLSSSQEDGQAEQDRS